jgi:hypothetical protein
MKHVILHALPPTSHFVFLLTCSHSTGPKISHFYRTLQLIIKFTKAHFGSYILDQLYPFHNIPLYPLQKSPTCSYALTFFMHMLYAFIIEALRTTYPVSHVLNLIALIMLAHSYVYFILLISSLALTQICN